MKHHKVLSGNTGVILARFHYKIMTGEIDYIVVKRVVELIGEIIGGSRPDNEPFLTEKITIGLLRNTRGFYQDKVIAYNIVAAYQQKLLYDMFVHVSINPKNPSSLAMAQSFFEPMENQAARVLPLIMSEATQKHGMTACDSTQINNVHQLIEQMHKNNETTLNELAFKQQLSDIIVLH